MFEDITFRNKDHIRVSRTSRQLLSKYKELKKFTEIYKKSNNSNKQKLRRHKGKVLEILHNELNKKLKPEETYEIWHDLANVLNKNVAKKVSNNNTRMNNKKKKKTKTDMEMIIDKENNSDTVIDKVNSFLEKLGNGDIEEFEENDHRYEEYDIIMSNKLNQFLNNFDNSNRLSKSKFIIESNGLEILPIEDDKDQSKSIFNHHLKNLTNLLHLQIMKQNWKQSYKIFSILIRFPQVDLRSIWPLGIEILLHMNEIHQKNNLWSLKVKKFFNYLSSFYLISNVNATTNSKVNNRSNVAPVWRSGSKTLTPMYIITSLWYLFILQDYEQVMNRINELILEPPYNLEGVLYFIASLCSLCNGFKIVEAWKIQNEDMVKFTNEMNQPIRSQHQVSEELNKIEKDIMNYLKKCTELQFIFPKEQIEQELKHLHHAVQEKKNITNESSSSENEEQENESDDLDWGAISSDSSENENEEEEDDDKTEEARNKSQISLLASNQPTQLDDINYNHYSDHDEEDEQEEHETEKESRRESLKQIDMTDDNITMNGHSLEKDDVSFDEIPATQPIILPDTQPIEYQDYQKDINMRGEDDDEEEEEEEEEEYYANKNNNFGSFDTRRNSLELYSTKSSSVEPDSKRNIQSQNESQQTMLDFDFDFDSDSN